MDEEQHQQETKSLDRVSLYNVNYGSITKPNFSQVSTNFRGES